MNENIIWVELARLPIAKMQDVLMARFVGRDEATKMGFPPAILTRLATAISEITRNVVQHAGCAGEIQIGRVTEGDRHGLRIIVSDHGRGIEHLERFLNGRQSRRARIRVARHAQFGGSLSHSIGARGRHHGDDGVLETRGRFVNAGFVPNQRRDAENTESRRASAKTLPSSAFSASLRLTRNPKLPVANPMQGVLAQTFESAGSRDFPVPCFRVGTGDRKVARTRRLESLRYGRSLIRLRFSSLIRLRFIRLPPCASRPICVHLRLRFRAAFGFRGFGFRISDLFPPAPPDLDDSIR